MKLLISVVILAGLFSFAQAEEVQLSAPYLIGKVPVKTKKYDKDTKQWNDVEGFAYSFAVYLRNVSAKVLTVATEGLSRQTSPDSPEQEVILDMSKMTFERSLVIPSRDELRLVELRPNEVDVMKVEFQTTVPLRTIKVTYHPQDFYDGRFGYWTGKVTSDPLTLKEK